MLCEYCENELNNVCYSKVNIKLQIEQRKGMSLKGTNITVCSRYRGTTAKRKRMMEEEAAWYRESEKWPDKEKKRRT